MVRRVIDKSAVKRAAVRSAVDSASLERRVVPNGYVRSAKLERYVAQRSQRG